MLSTISMSLEVKKAAISVEMSIVTVVDWDDTFGSIWSFEFFIRFKAAISIFFCKYKTICLYITVGSFFTYCEFITAVKTNLEAYNKDLNISGGGRKYIITSLVKHFDCLFFMVMMINNVGWRWRLRWTKNKYDEKRSMAKNHLHSIRSPRRVLCVFISLGHAPLIRSLMSCFRDIYTHLMTLSFCVFFLLLKWSISFVYVCMCSVIRSNNGIQVQVSYNIFYVTAKK